MKQKLINTLTIFSVLATGAGLGLPGLVKWKSQGTLAGLDVAVLLLAASIFVYGSVCGGRYLLENLKIRSKT